MGISSTTKRSDCTRHPRVLSRRQLITGAAALAAAGVLSANAARSDQLARLLRVEGDIGFWSGVTASESGVRGEMVQVQPPPPPPEHWLPGQFITHVDVVGRRMALTFDDGPSPYNTYSVLQTLSNYGIKATFFLVGVNVRAFPTIARHIAEAGHELGNHSIYHTPYTSYGLASQIAGNQVIIRDATGVTPVVHRAPGLTKGSAILNSCAASGLYEVHTHMSTFDWHSPRHPAWQLINEFIRYHRNGAIPIYHDGGGRRPTPDALPGIIDYAKSVGYTFVPATELVNSGTPLPATFGYALSLESAALDEMPDMAGYEYDYDAEAELIAILDRDDLGLKQVDRSRIVDVLADIEAAKLD
jgi:peptidoglycan/xylan/chitin deacetylase (PgdA/CDA1 family)